MNAPPSDPPLGDTVAHIRSLLPLLVPSERRVAQECVDRPEAVVEMSGADLADHTGTSPATVSRTCRSLGLRGFQHLRMLLVRDLGARAQASAEEPPGTPGRLQLLAEGASAMLLGALRGVDPAAFDAAADLVAAGRRVVIVGSGGSMPAVQATALRFVTSGRACEAPLDSVTQQLTSAVLVDGDVCLAVSESGANNFTIAAAAAAAAGGAKVIGVTSYPRAPLAEHCDVLLVAGSRPAAWDGGGIGGNLVQLLLLSGLQQAVAERTVGSARARAATMGEVIELTTTVEGETPGGEPDARRRVRGPASDS
ncbi:MurR/RpiR family transcriptional regulator [Microbacterium sp. NPDC096154]|uniref:MurR/RpiR family transcriptional regulator n=1 Tax=Microbacterium sp. NPDC096154 TaxID=3155549 RepID=UPI00332D1B24